MPAAKPTSLNHPACLPRLALVVAVVLGLGLSLLGADATAQTRATLVPAPEEASNTILVLDYSNSMWGQIDGDYTIVTTGEVTDTDFPDHTYTEELSGPYAGPVVRLNYDSDLGGKLGAHFGGSLQALYGRSALSARQAFSTKTNTFEATDTGFMVGVGAEAGLSYQITPALKLGVGVYGTLTQGAPEVAAAVDPAANQQPSLKGGSWSEMGLKGSISTTF